MTTDPATIGLQELTNERPDEPPTLSERVDRLEATMQEIRHEITRLEELAAQILGGVKVIAAREAGEE